MIKYAQKTSPGQKNQKGLNFCILLQNSLVGVVGFVRTTPTPPVEPCDTGRALRSGCIMHEIQQLTLFYHMWNQRANTSFTAKCGNISLKKLIIPLHQQCSGTATFGNLYLVKTVLFVASTKHSKSENFERIILSLSLFAKILFVDRRWVCWLTLSYYL